MVVLPVLWMLAVHPLALQIARSLVVLSLCMVGQGLYCSRVDRVVISILDPPVSGDHIIPNPSGGRRRLLGETQGNLVARIHDHVAVINARQQFADISIASVVSLKVAPDLPASSN